MLLPPIAFLPLLRSQWLLKSYLSCPERYSLMLQLEPGGRLVFMMPNNPSLDQEVSAISYLADDASKSAFSLDHPLTSLANKRSKAHSEAGKQAKAALDPIKHHKAKHHKAKHHKKQKHVSRFLLSPAAGNGVQFANFADTSSLKLNGNSSKAGNVLRLTPAQKSQAGQCLCQNALQH